jgi:hypothetical protein
MTVYAESNFVLEYALEQEQCESCEEIVRIAEARLIEFVLPAFFAHRTARGTRKKREEPFEAE